jgi:hypothetical protein
MLNKTSQTQKDKYCVFPHMQNLDFFLKDRKVEGRLFEKRVNRSEYDQSTLYTSIKMS